MEQKTKLSILILLLIVVIAGSVYLIQNKEHISTTQKTIATLQSGQKLPETVNRDDMEIGSIAEVSGKIRSINETAVYIELADGNGFAVKINPQTPVATQGVDKPGSLADLEYEQNVTVKFDKEKTIEILIKK